MELEKLSADVVYYRRKMHEMMGYHNESNVVLPYFKEDRKDQHLPRDSKIQFLIPHPWAEGKQGNIQVRHADEFSLDVTGSAAIVIEPYASNRCVIRFGPT